MTGGRATEAVVATTRLTKSYGSIVALRDLDLVVSRGEIVGYLGPNGAGKTTTIRLLLGLLRPSHGQARVLGLDCWADSVEVRRRLGYLPGDVRFYDFMTGRRLLMLFDRLRGGGGEYDGLAERLRLDLDRRIKGYSKGMKQKLGLVQALMHDPELLILDEPTSSLDPLVQEEVYALLRERRAVGRTVFLSSHVLSEVQKICDRVAIVGRGRLLRVEEVQRLRDLDLRKVAVHFADPAAGHSALAAAGYTFAGEEGILTGTVEEIDPFIKTLAALEVRALSVEPLSLEEIFFQLYEKGA